MQQLGELRQHSDDFARLDAQVLVVFRESREGPELLTRLAREYDLTERIELALDFGAERTAAWSPEGYHTYVIDDEGVVRRILRGETTDRPTGASIVAAVEAVARTDADE